MNRKTESNLHENLSYGIKDGAFYSMMVGIGENYLIPFALFLKATNAQVGFIVSVPQLIGALFQILSVYLLSGLNSRKQLILAGVGFQAVAWLPLLWLPILFPAAAVQCLIFGTSLYYLLGNLASPPWNSMMGDLVPYDQRGKYFGKRTKIMSLSSFAALLIGGMILNATSRTSFPSSGFIIIFMTAALFRWISFLFLRMMEEPEVDLRESRFHLGDFYRHFKNSNFLVFVVYSALISFSVQVAGPFFSVYMLHDLGFSYLQYMIVIGSAVLSQYLTYVYWGNFSDRFGNRMVLKITGLLMPLLPLLWLISSNFYYIIGVQLFAGFVWAGFSLSVSIFVFDAVASEQRAVCIAVYSTLNALGIFLGAMTGGLFTKIFPDSFSILHFQFHLKSNLICLFLISGILRILVYLTFLPKIQEVREVEVFTLKEAFQKTVR